MSSLSRLRPDTRFSMNAVPIANPGTKAVSTVWIAGEVPAGAAGRAWAQGGTVTLDLKAGTTATTSRVTLVAGDRTFAIAVKLPTPVESGSAIRTSTRSSSRCCACTHSLGTEFSRTERVRLEFPAVNDSKTATGRLLDKAGEPLTIPVTVGERTDAQTGQRWITAEITLAPLAAGDYAVELTRGDAAAQQKIVTAIRVTK